MIHEGSYRRSDWVKTPNQLDSYIEGFVKRIQAHYPNINVEMTRDPLVEKPLKFALRIGDDAVATVLIAHFVHRDSKITLDKIANYCIGDNMNSERFLWRAINEHVDNAHKIYSLNKKIGALQCEIDRLKRRHPPLWKRIWNFIVDWKGKSNEKQ